MGGNMDVSSYTIRNRNGRPVRLTELASCAG